MAGTAFPLFTARCYVGNISFINDQSGGDFIRLLQPDDEDAMLWHLHIKPLSSSPKFAAISYSWGGGDTRPASMSIQYHPFLSPPESITDEVQISVDNRQALVALSENNAYGWLWMDGICINQWSFTKKNDQVSRMREIYERAEVCLIWLGPVVQDHGPYMDEKTVRHPA